MDAMRKKNRFEFELDENSARGLYAVIAGHPEWVTPEQYNAGQQVYGWFFGSVQELAMDFDRAMGRKKTG